MVATNSNTIVEGKIASVNSHGIRLEGRQEWVNWSKWANVTATPAPGTFARIRLDGSGYMRELITIESGSEPDSRTFAERPNGSARPSTVVAPPPIAEPAQPLKAPDKDRQITRMACLNTAVAIASSGGREVDTDKVISIAGRLELWIGRWY